MPAPPLSPDKFLSCDWGTTNFRLTVVDAATGDALLTHATDRGIRRTDQDFRESGAPDRFRFFANYLLARIAHLPEPYRALPVVASGMASANIGMLELPYAALPLDATGGGLVTAVRTLANAQEVLIVGGLRGPADVMRGEEVQALGLLPRMTDGPGTLILPGTHSKHLMFTGSTIAGFTTYLTGELFALLSRESILAHSVVTGPLEGAAVDALCAGAAEGRAGRLTAALFSLRARDLLEGAPHDAAYHYLSGLLIGDELRHLKPDARIYLAADEPVLTAYRLALEDFLDAGRLITFDGPSLRRALHFGQLTLLHRHA